MFSVCEIAIFWEFFQMTAMINGVVIVLDGRAMVTAVGHVKSRKESWQYFCNDTASALVNTVMLFRLIICLFRFTQILSIFDGYELCYQKMSRLLLNFKQ